MNARNSFTALATVAALVAPAPVLAQDWQGAWNTTYGQIRLVEDGDYVYGDYGSIGTIEGVLVQNRQILRAIFTRKDDGSKGYVEWILSGDDGNRISGYWNWTSAAFPSWDGSTAGTKWRGDRTDEGIPPITQFGPRRSRVQFLAASPSPYRNWLGKGRVQASTGATAAPVAQSVQTGQKKQGARQGSAAHEFAGNIPAFRDISAQFMPEWIDVRVDRIGMGADEFFRYELFGLVGIYVYCQTPAGSVALKPYYGKPNRILDRPRANAETGPITFRADETVRRFAFDSACLRQKDGHIAIQLQTNLKEKDLTPVTDDKFGYRGFDFRLSDLPRERKWTSFLAKRGEFTFLRSSDTRYAFKVSEKIDAGRLAGEKFYVLGSVEFGR